MGLSSCIAKARDSIKKSAKKKRNVALREGRPDDSAQYQAAQEGALDSLIARIGDIKALDGDNTAAAEAILAAIEDLKLDRENVVIQIDRAGGKAPAMPELVADKNAANNSNVELENRIKIAADSIDKLRKVDVERVLTQGNLDQQAMADYIKRKRPDLAAEVDEVMEDVRQESSKWPEVASNLRPGFNVTFTGHVGGVFHPGDTAKVIATSKSAVQFEKPDGGTAWLDHNRLDRGQPGGWVVVLENTKSTQSSQIDAELSAALSELGDVLGDIFGAKMNITGKQYGASDLLPALSKVIELLVRKGFVKFSDAVSQAAKVMRSNEKTAPFVDQVSARQWKAAYNAIAEYHNGADSEEAVASITSDKVANMVSGAKNTGANVEMSQASDTLKEIQQSGADDARTLQSEVVPGADQDGNQVDVTNGNRDRQPVAAGVAGDGQGADSVRRVPERADVPGVAGNQGQDGQQHEPPVELGKERGDGALGRTADAKQDVDHVIDAEDIGKGGLTKKYRDNIAAIKIIKAMEAEGRVATPEERKQIARYVGWGAVKGVFDPANNAWSKQHEELKSLLTDAEFYAARKSTLNAHYTSPIAVGAMYAALERLGFTGGRVLEPSVGVGNFFGLMPAKIRNASNLHGVELDSLTSRLAAALYPKAKIAQSTGFQDYSVPSEFFDLVIGNPPFGSEPIVDSERSPYSGFSIHNYFLAKSIDKLRPGGIMQVVVSHNFLDAQDSRVRKWIADRANLIGAARLPNTAFKENAGTEVVTDILIFQKKSEDEAANGLGNNAFQWVNVVDQQITNPKTGENITHKVSELFASNPFLVLGQPSSAGSMYRANEYTVEATGDIKPMLDAWVKSLPENIFTPIDRRSDKNIVDMEIPDGVKPGSYFVSESGELMRRGEDVMGNRTAYPHVPKTNAAAQRIKGMIVLRELLRKQMRMERSTDANESEIEANRAALNKAYDEFVNKYGHVNNAANRSAFMDDTEAQLVQALEFDFDKGISDAVAKREEIESKPPKAKKADIFNRRVMFPPSDFMKVETAKDALLASLNYRGKVDLGYMGEVYSKNADEIIKELGDVVFDDPQSGIVMADEYLSGDVKTKLAEAKEAAISDAKYQRNIEALEKVIPADKKPSEISVSIGASFVPAEIYQQFIRHITGAGAAISYLKSTGQWLIDYDGSPDMALNTGTFGTSSMDARELFKLSMMGRGAVVKRIIKNPDGSTTTVVLEKETESAREKQNSIKDEWRKWLWSDAARADKIAEIYNDKMNRIVVRKFDGSHMTFPGMNPSFTLLDHQKNGVWRGLQSYQVLYDHVVGAGKTFEMAALAMEMRRLGISRKPLFVVPNHLTLQWRGEFTRLYPGSNILAASPEDFSKENRGRMFSKIVTGDWDAVIIGHSSLKKIGLPEATEQAVLEEQINEIADAIEEMKRNRGDKRIVATMEQIRARLEAKMREKLTAIGKRDKVLTFDELGVDALFIDEMHEFKNLSYNSTMDRNPGMGNPAGSAKAFDLFVKTRWLFDTFGDKTPFVTATGTPVSNSLVEMFNMQRYMQYPTLKQESLHVFDAWAKQFGSVENVYEVAPSGSGFRQSSRFAKFTNLPALMSLYGSFADTVTLDDLKRQEESRGKRFPVPKISGGRPTLVVAKRSPAVANLMGVPRAVLDESGNVVFGVDLDKPIDVSQNDLGKWVAKVGELNLGAFETEQDANLRIVERALAPLVAVDDASILGRFGNLKELTKKTKGKVNALSLTSEANKAGLDYRLINPSAPDFPGSKINLAIGHMMDIYRKSSADKGTQLIFCDMSIPLSARASYSTKERRLYVRDEDGLVVMKRGTLHSAEGYETLPFFIVAKGEKAFRRFDVYDAATGFLVGGNFTSKQEAKDRTANLLESESSREKWLDKRLGFAEIDQGQIDEYNNENDIETDGVEYFGPEDVAGVSGAAQFSVYDDIKAKLVANGVTEREVAFIHDYATPASKAKLFSAVKSGDVRFLLGSTPKMGAGTNVQDLLVGLHHIDAPWRPSDLEQREGRIIRQGNKLYERDPEGFEVFIGRYATEQTYDTRRWQILEHKARGIEQLRNFDGTANEIEDIDGEAANAADMKAAASGDPLILEETKLRNEVKRLERLQDGHADEKVAMERKANELQKYANESGPASLATIQALIAESQKHPADKRGFSQVTIGGKKFSDIEDATKEIAATFAMVRAGGMSGATVVFRGQRFSISKPFGETVSVETDIGSLGLWAPSEAFSASGFVQRMINHVERLSARETDIASKIEKAKDDVVKLREQAKQPFMQAQDLEFARTEHRRVRRALMAKGPAVPDSERPMVDAAIAKQKERLASLGFSDALNEIAANPVFNKTDEAIPESNWLPTAELVDLVDNLLKQFSTEIPVTIIDNESDVLPDDSAGDNNIAGQQGAASGFVYRGRVHLVRSGIVDAKAAANTLFHELLHFGIRRFVPESQYIAQMEALYRDDPWIQGKTEDWLNSADGLEFVRKTKNERLAAARGVDEALAQLAEALHDERTSPGVKVGSRLSKVVQSVINWLKRVAEQLGFGVVKQRLDDLKPGQEAKDYVESIFKKLREGSPPSMMNRSWVYADQAFSRKEAPSVAGPTIDAIVTDNFRSIVQAMKATKQLIEDC